MRNVNQSKQIRWQHLIIICSTTWTQCISIINNSIGCGCKHKSMQPLHWMCKVIHSNIRSCQIRLQIHWWISGSKRWHCIDNSSNNSNITTITIKWDQSEVVAVVQFRRRQLQCASGQSKWPAVGMALDPKNNSFAVSAIDNSPKATIYKSTNEHTPTNGHFRARFVAKLFGVRTICVTTNTSIRKINHSSAMIAAKDFANHERWPCIVLNIPKRMASSAPYANKHSHSDHRWKHTCVAIHRRPRKPHSN